MKILLLGGTGFLGSYLSNHLGKGHQVTSTSSSGNDDCIKYDAEADHLPAVLNNKRYDVIINNINPQNLPYNVAVKLAEEVAGCAKMSDAWLIQVSSIFAQLHNRGLNAYSLKKALSDDIIIQEMPKEKYTILRFPQLFDAAGLARKSQGGLYYLLDSIRNNQPIALFSNHVECTRNYLPVEIFLAIFDLVIHNFKKGLFNAYSDSFSLEFSALIRMLTALNPAYDAEKLISVGENKGFAYTVETQSDELIAGLDFESPQYYFERAYNQLNFQNV